MKACANPKCPNHIDVSELCLRDTGCFAKATVSNVFDGKREYRIERVSVHLYTSKDPYRPCDFFLCDSCDNAVRMIQELP